MNHNLQEAISSLYDLHEQCNTQLEDKINDFVMYIENNESGELSKWALRGYANKIKDWMKFYNGWISDAIDEIESEYAK